MIVAIAKFRGGVQMLFKDPALALGVAAMLNGNSPAASASEPAGMAEESEDAGEQMSLPEIPKPLFGDVAAFLAECCRVGPCYVVSSRLLAEAYRAWCDDRRERALPPAEFSAALRAAGFLPKVPRNSEHKQFRAWRGLQLESVGRAELRLMERPAEVAAL
jgi:hypothetical protein